jgi:hypothetical protein
VRSLILRQCVLSELMSILVKFNSDGCEKIAWYMPVRDDAPDSSEQIHLRTCGYCPPVTYSFNTKTGLNLCFFASYHHFESVLDY